MCRNKHGIDLKTDFYIFRQAVVERFGDHYAVQTELFFAKAYAEAEDGSLDYAISYAEFAYKLSQFQPENYSVIYLIGFLTQIHLDKNDIIKAKKYCDLGFEMLEKESVSEGEDYRMFSELREMIKSEGWK